MTTARVLLNASERRRSAAGPQQAHSAPNRTDSGVGARLGKARNATCSTATMSGSDHDASPTSASFSFRIAMSIMGCNMWLWLAITSKF